MIANIDPMKSALTSLFSVIAGSSYNYCNVTMAYLTLSSANTAFQHLAWTVAILAGIVSIVNGIIKIKQSKNPSKNEKDD
jgi:general stress protein CsbA